jgi:hypothetical protein
MAFSGMLRRVALVRTDVSEELSASFIKVTRTGEPGTTLAVTSNRRSLQPHPVAFLPFVGTVFNRISRALARHNIKSVGLPHMKLSSLLHPVKDTSY